MKKKNWIYVVIAALMMAILGWFAVVGQAETTPVEDGPILEQEGENATPGMVVK